MSTKRDQWKTGQARSSLAVDALLELERVPGKVKVHDVPAELEVESFGEPRRRHEDAAVAIGAESLKALTGLAVGETVVDEDAADRVRDAARRAAEVCEYDDALPLGGEREQALQRSNLAK